VLVQVEIWNNIPTVTWSPPVTVKNLNNIQVIAFAKLVDCADFVIDYAMATKANQGLMLDDIFFMMSESPVPRYVEHF